MKSNKIPERKCVACQAHKEKKSLIRIVKNAEGEVFIDITGKANGRGAYICKSGECLDSAQKKRRIEAALKTKIPDDVFSNLEKIITENNINNNI